MARWARSYIFHFRMSIAMFWFGIVSFNGSECTFQMVKALWPSFADVPNQLPASAGITSVGMISYVLFWAIQFPFLLVSPRDIRYFFVVKAVLAPATCLGMLIWAIMRVSPATSLGPGSKLHENHAPFWVWLSAMTSATGAWSTLAINIPDFTRYAVDERAQFIQILVIPMFMTLVGFCGIVVASTTDVLYGTIIWDPLRVIDRWDSRPAKFFAAFSFTMAVLGTNISANSLSAANDLTVLFPRYVNIRRGQVICAIVGCWVICPWKILASAPGFLNFISAYAVFLAPLASILVVDYWIVRKRRVDLIEIYLPEGRYRYWHGINWRAALAFVVGLGPNIPGLVATLDPTIIVGRPLLKVYDVAWLYGIIDNALRGSQPDFLDLANLWHEVPELIPFVVLEVFFHYLDEQTVESILAPAPTTAHAKLLRPSVGAAAARPDVAHGALQSRGSDRAGGA
ncbi:unnamed protein product [Mycena citricolor]|uniref:Uncharacterized protein n=1 Tax=Mycena citricolor TaxID=2018698 RepID=A0AAD2H2Z7_9AGAR|nr:unnamed protein product [Mycena citricolor]